MDEYPLRTHATTHPNFSSSSQYCCSFQPSFSYCCIQPNGEPLSLRTIAQPAEQKTLHNQNFFRSMQLGLTCKKILLLPHFTPLQLQQSQMKELFLLRKKKKQEQAIGKKTRPSLTHFPNLKSVKKDTNRSPVCTVSK